MRGRAAGAIREGVTAARLSGECPIGFTSSLEAGERLRKTSAAWYLRMVLKIAACNSIK